MPDTAVSGKDAAGSTYNVDTYTQASGDHRQAVVVGDATAAHTLAVDSAGRLVVLSQPADQTVTATAAAGAAVTLTLPAPAAGQFHHIVALSVVCYNSAARTGSATPVLVTTTNIPNTPSFVFPSAGAVGTVDRLIEDFAQPLRSSVAATATTVVAPATANVIWRLRAHYYTAP